MYESATRYSAHTWAPADAAISSPGNAGTEVAMSLEIRDLRSGYRQGEVLHGVDLDLEPGCALALLGRNGAGKTTLMLTLMGLVRPAGGSVKLNGRELAGRRTDQIARAGI